MASSDAYWKMIERGLAGMPEALKSLPEGQRGRVALFFGEPWNKEKMAIFVTSDDATRRSMAGAIIGGNTMSSNDVSMNALPTALRDVPVGLRGHLAMYLQEDDATRATFVNADAHTRVSIANEIFRLREHVWSRSSSRRSRSADESPIGNTTSSGDAGVRYREYANCGRCGRAGRYGRCGMCAPTMRAPMGPLYYYYY